VINWPRLRVVDVGTYERSVRLRIPFRFGVITVTEATQAVIRATIRLADGRIATGIAAECLAAKWFDKTPRLTDAQNLDQLRQALALAIAAYRAVGPETAFGMHEAAYPALITSGHALGLDPLVVGFGPALLDRAILDALGRALGLSFQAMIRANVPGIRAMRLAPDLAGFDLDRFLATREPRAHIDVRHTVGLLDPLVAAERSVPPLTDGLPETLEEVVRAYGGRWYKLKVSGQIDADLDRLSRIAAVLDAGPPYRATLDGNEQFDDADGVAELWRRMHETRSLARLCASIAFIEQPIRRMVALERFVGSLATAIPMLIDESDGDYDAFPRALALGYGGVSSKTCKGLYKSLLNAARVARHNAGAGRPEAFMSAEDLTTWPGVSVQQDLALVGLIGITHVERNAHHFIDGMAFAPPAEQAAFVAAHPDLYRMTDGPGPARLRVADGRLRLGSLDCPGFAVAAETDVAALTAMPAAPRNRIAPARDAP
jgi:hypothetical protein